MGCHRGERDQGVNPDLKISELYLANIYIGWRSADGQWDANFFVKNILDDVTGDVIGNIQTGSKDLLKKLPALNDFPVVKKEKFDFPFFMKILGDASKLVKN